MLKLLPDLVYPITQSQSDALMDNIVQLNLMEGSLTEKQQRGLGLFFHIFDIWVKTGGRIDYRSREGHYQLVNDCMSFVGSGNPVATRYGDLPAAHLAIDFHDTMMRLKSASLPLLSMNVNDLLDQCADLAEYPPEMEKRIGLLLDYLGKRRLL